MPSLLNFHPHCTSPSNIDPNLKVAFVMDICISTWNLDSIKRLISDEEAKAIVRILSGSNTASDKFIWSYEKSGKYIVKSG